jgi:hypothetical protein
MAEASTPTVPPPVPAPSRTALRIVLFGLPAAGKSSLLGALAQAAQVQEHLLHGRLSDPSHGLDELQRRVYADKPQRTAEEIVPYPIRFEPFSNGTADGSLDAVLIDCDGRVANDLLVRRSALPDDSPEGTLSREVLDADTLLLVVDAAAPPAQIEDDFAEFGRFLRLFESSRGKRTEVGGLPVYLVLAKCDLLAQPQDRPTDWIERIEERKRQVDQRFRAFLDRDPEDGAPAFGHVDLRVWATAVKRPALAGVPGKPSEPYGVAELFRQCLDSARAFRQRTKQSARRLLWTVAGAGGVLAVMATLILGLAVRHRDAPSGELQNQVDNYLFTEGQTVSERLRGGVPQLRQRLGVLSELVSDSGFATLPTNTQDLLRQRQKELQEYIPYLEQLQALRPLEGVGKYAELQAAEVDLVTKLSVPHTEWAQTEAARIHDTRLAQVRALRQEADRLAEWYATRATDAKSLWFFADRNPNGDATLNWPAWQDRARALLNGAQNPPVQPTDPVPGASGFTFATVLGLDKVTAARSDWETSRGRVEALRDLTAALGLGGESPDHPAALVIPATPPFTLNDARERLDLLHKNYPRFEKELASLDLPDDIKRDVQAQAQMYYQRMLPPAREEVLRRLRQASPDGKETLAHWKVLLDWLADPPELRSWRELASVYLRLEGRDPVEADPISELAAFIKGFPFRLDLASLQVDYPENLSKRPGPHLTVYLKNNAGQVTEYLYDEVPSERKRDPQRPVMHYLYRPVNRHTMTFESGDEMWATLPLTDPGGEDGWRLTWTDYRSSLFTFDRLALPPRLHRTGPSTEGKVEEGVHLTVSPKGGLPATPDLLPFVKLEPR